MKKIAMLVVVAGWISGSAWAQQAAPAAGDMQDAMKALGALFGGGAAATNAVIHHRQLKELLPAEVAGMKRTNSEAGKQAAFGMNISYAQATYTAGDARIEAKISDISAMGEFVKMAQYAWAQSEMERESETGYERTTKIDGFPAQESYDTESKSGNLQVMVDGRFVVELDGSGVEMDKLTGLLKEINVKKLAGLQPEAN